MKKKSRYIITRAVFTLALRRDSICLIYIYILIFHILESVNSKI